MACRGERYRRCLGSNTCVPTGCRRLLPDGTALTRARCSHCCLSSSHSLRRTSGLSGSPCLTSRRIQGGRVRCTSFHRASPSASPTGRPNRRRRNRGQGRPTRTERAKSVLRLVLWGTLRHGEGRRPRSRRRQRLARRGRRHRTRTLHAHNPGRSAASGPRDRATLEVRATRSRTQRPYPRAQHIRHRSTPEQGIDPPAARGVLGR